MTAMRWKSIKTETKKENEKMHTLSCMRMQIHTCTEAHKYETSFMNKLLHKPKLFGVVQQFVHTL